MGNALHGDLGTDYYYQLPVTQVIKEALPITLSLVIGAAIIWMVLGIVSGVVSAVRPRSFTDRTITVLALIFYSVPSFVLGLTLIYVFYYRLTVAGFPIFPAGGYKPLSDGLNQWFFHLVLPWITLAMISVAIYSRLTRGSMLEVLGEDYIKTARSKGIPEKRVVYRHALRSALTPVAHPVRDRPRRVDRGSSHHRDRLQPARGRLPVDQGDPEPGPAADHRRRAGRRQLRSWWPTSSSTSSTRCSIRASS